MFLTSQNVCDCDTFVFVTEGTDKKETRKSGS